MGLKCAKRTLSQLPWLLLALGWPGWASEPERAALQVQRRAIEQRFIETERACQSRFFVNACVDDARSAQREALAPLRMRELSLDEAERQQRARQRRVAVADKQQEAAARAGAAGVAAPEGEVAPAPLTEVNTPAVRERSPPKSPAATAAAQAQAAAAAQAAQAAALAEKRVQAAQRRAEAASEAQARVEKRIAQRAAKGKKSSPLPVPPLADAPATAASAARRPK